MLTTALQDELGDKFPNDPDKPRVSIFASYGHSEQIHKYRH
eukprot:COSAG02_NODE_32800_length_510_cov_1.114355_1_plen_41_part_00